MVPSQWERVHDTPFLANSWIRLIDDEGSPTQWGCPHRLKRVKKSIITRGIAS